MNLEEVEYSDIVAAGWNKYLIYTSKMCLPEYASNDKIHNMYWLRDKYDFNNATVRCVTWNGDHITFEMDDVYDKNRNCDIIKDHILIDRLTLTFGQVVVRSAVVIDRANHIYIGDSIWPQYSEPDIYDEKFFNSFFESIKPSYIRYFGIAEKDTAFIFLEFSDKKTLELKLSCDEIGNTDRKKCVLISETRNKNDIN